MSCASGHGAHPGPDGGRRARLRPILMTTFAIIAGMLPVALGSGDGSASRASLAKVVVGGQALCLVVTLLMTPVIYSTFDDMRGLRLFARIRFPRWKAALADRLVGRQRRSAADKRPSASLPPVCSAEGCDESALRGRLHCFGRRRARTS